MTMDERFEQKFQDPLNQALHAGSDSTSADHSRKPFSPGQMIDNRFRIVRELGRGGTGTVYQVDQVLLKQSYAMKVLDPLQINDEAWRRFQKEAQAAGKLDHPGFVKVHDFGLIDNQIPYFTMDLVQGETLAERLRRNGPIPVAQALPIFIQLCFALDYAHSKGVIHRDIKPSNISISKDDTTNGEQIKILDFGIAKLVGVDTTSLTKVGAVFGTPFYMSPEQCLGQPVDFRSDIYSLGCVFFEVLAGAPPFTSEQALTLMMQHQSEKPPSLKEVSMGGQFPSALEELIRKMLAKNPNNRYQRLTEMVSDLMELQQGKTPKVSVPNKSEATSTSTKLKVAAIALVATVLLGAAAAGTMYFQSRKAEAGANNNAAKTLTAADSTINVIDPSVDALSTNLGTDDDAVTTAEFFSVPEVRSGISYRVFNFPKKKPIGEIGFTELGKDVKHYEPAVGKIEVACNPGKPCIEFRPSWQMCNTSPQLLKKFRPDEVGCLSFDDNDVRKSVIPDDIYDNTLTFVDNLKSIYFIDVPTPATDASIPHLAKLPKLVSIRCSRTKLTGDGLSRLPQLASMKHIAMGMLKNARAALPVLKHSQTLEALKLVADGVTDADLKLLSKISSLRELVLRRNPGITDAGVKYLVGTSPHLYMLALDGCNITPKSISTLKQLNVVNFISIDVSGWSKADVAELLKQVKCDVCSYDSKNSKYVSLRSASQNNLKNGDASGGMKNERQRGAIDYGD